MRICVISTPVFAVNSPNGTAGYSGLEVIAWLQAKGLAERGHQVALVAPEGSDCSGAEVIPCGPAGTWDETKAYSTYWHRLPEFDAVIDHSVVGDESLLVRIDGKERWMTMKELHEWAMKKSHVLLDGKSMEVPVRGLEIPSAVGLHKIRWKVVSAVIRHKRKDKIYAVKTKFGCSVNVTAGHSIMVAGDHQMASVRADESVGRYAAIARRIPANVLDRPFWPLEEADISKRMKSWNLKHEGQFAFPIPLTDSDLVMFGLWVGDGCYDGDRSVLLASGKKTFRVVRKVAREFDAACGIDSKWPEVKCRINSTVLVCAMKAIGLVGDCYTKKLPDWVFGLSRRQIGLLLRGYFSSDGHVGRAKLCASSVSHELIRQLSVLLAMCGIRSHSERCDKNRTSSVWDCEVASSSTIYVTQDAWPRYLKWVGFVQEDRNEYMRASLLKRKSKRGDVPYCLIRSRPLRSDSLVGDSRTISLSKLAGRRDAKTVARFEKSAIDWRRIVSSEPTEREDEFVYDLSVPGTENFFVGSVCCHNSWMKWSYLLKAEGRLPQPILGVMHAPVDTMYRTWPPKFPGTEQVAAGRAVCISEDQAAHFRAIHGRDARVIHNGIDVGFYQPIGVPRTDRFLFLARFSTIKGPDLAIEAAKKTGVGLDLVGDTSITNEPEFLERCKRMTDGKQIRFVGPATRGECVWWFSQAKALLHPNLRFREPFGLAPVEANACGCPVIAWDHGAMRETMGEGNVLVNDQAQLIQAIKLLAERKSDAETLRRNTIRFSAERMVERCEELVSAAVGGEAW